MPYLLLIRITVCIESLLTLRHFWNTVRRKISGFVPIQTMAQTSRRLGWFLYGAAQNFEIFSKIQTKIQKSKTYSGWCLFLRPIQWYHSHLAGRYLEEQRALTMHKSKFSHSVHTHYLNIRICVSWRILYIKHQAINRKFQKPWTYISLSKWL